MKKVAFIALLMMSTANAIGLSAQDIDIKVAKIQVTRGGMDISKFQTVSDPFVYYERNASTGAIIAPKTEDEITIAAIMNSKAYIDGSWKKVGDRIGSYVIKSIGVNFVILKNGGKIKKLFIGNKQENNFIKIQGR